MFAAVGEVLGSEYKMWRGVPYGDNMDL